MLIWSEPNENGEIFANDELALYAIGRANGQYWVHFGPASGPMRAWAFNVSDLDRAKAAAEACSQHVLKAGTV